MRARLPTRPHVQLPEEGEVKALELKLRPVHHLLVKAEDARAVRTEILNDVELDPQRGPRPQTDLDLAAVARAHRSEVLVERAPADREAAGREARRAEVARSREWRERRALPRRVFLEAEDPRPRLRAERVELAAQDREHKRLIRPGRDAQAGLPEGHRQAADGDRHQEGRRTAPPHPADARARDPAGEEIELDVHPR